MASCSYQYDAVVPFAYLTEHYLPAPPSPNAILLAILVNSPFQAWLVPHIVPSPGPSPSPSGQPPTSHGARPGYALAIWMQVRLWDAQHARLRSASLRQQLSGRRHGSV